jgi:hypothetical protein
MSQREESERAHVLTAGRRTAVGLCRGLSRVSGQPGWRLRWTEGAGDHYRRKRRSYWTASRDEAVALQQLLRVPGTTLHAAMLAIHAIG